MTDFRKQATAARTLALLFAALALCACGRDHDAGDATDGAAAALVGAPEGPVVATVNGTPLTAPLLEVFARGRGLDPNDPAQRVQALDTLIETLLLAQDGIAHGMTDRPEVQAEAALARLLQLSGRRVSELREAVQVGEEELRAYYKQEAARAGDTEYHLLHILFENEDAALAAAGEALQADSDFAALMTRYSGTSGVLQARDLGWANRTQLPPELAEAASTLPDGAVSPVPVRTEFGWHVIQRAASRPFNPPPFEDVRGGARRQLTEQALADQVKALREAADIELPQAGDTPPAATPNEYGG